MRGKEMMKEEYKFDPREESMLKNIISEQQMQNIKSYLKTPKKRDILVKDIEIDKLTLERLFLRAVSDDHFEIVNLCIKLGVNVNVTKHDMYGVKCECHRKLRYMNLVSDSCTTPPIMMTVRTYGGQKVFELLLSQPGIDVNKTTINSNSAIFEAIRGRRSHCFIYDKLLKFPGTNIGLKDNDGRTILHYAARYTTNPWLIKNLVKMGLNINDKDKDGITALHLFLSNYCPNKGSYHLMTLSLMLN